MSSFKGTPGPWCADQDGVTGSGSDGPDNVVLIWAGGPSGIKHEDARLIEAAPDLLAACEVLTANYQNERERDRAFYLALAALQKVYGE